MPTVVFRGSRAELSELIAQVARMASGRAPDTADIGQSVAVALGFAALSDIKDAFVVKARGGTDAMGIRWPELKPETIANRRVGRGASDKAKKRERIRKRETKKALARFRPHLPEGEAQRRAAIVGGLRATHEMGETKVQTLGGRQVEILRDTGVMLNSLSPGSVSGASYAKPGGEGGEEQIFRAVPGEVAIGSNVLYFRTHNQGDKSRGIPQRKVLPDEESPVPPSWWANWARAANRALVSGLVRAITRAG